MVADNTNANARSVTKKKRNPSTYNLDKKSFFHEHLKDVNVVMLGDSITDTAEWELLFPSVLLADQGINGDTTAGMLNRLDLVLNTNASKVFIMAGINDLFNGINVDNIFANYEKIVEHLVSKNIDVYIQSTLLLGEGNENININNKVLKLNSMLEKYADSNNSITFINLNSKLSDGKFLIAEYTSDQKTLNGKGYAVWRDVIKPYIL